jgi:hypothetical protein
MSAVVKGIAARHPMQANRMWNLAEAAGTLRDFCWQRQNLTWDCSLGCLRMRRSGDVPDRSVKVWRITGDQGCFKMT